MRRSLRGITVAVSRISLQELSRNPIPAWTVKWDKRHLSTSGYSANSRRPSYYHRSDVSTPLVNSTLGQIIDDAADKYGDRLAIVDVPQGLRKTYTEYKKDVDDLAAGFLALNFKRNDRIAIWSPNRYEWLVTKYAAAKAGLVLVTLNAAYQPQELEYSLQKLRLRALVLPESFKALEYFKFVCQVVPETLDSKPGQIKSKKHPYLETLIVLSEKNFPGAFRFSDVQRMGGSDDVKQLEKLKWEIDCDSSAHIQLTSGTTGRPKAALMSHYSMVNNAISCAENLGQFSRETNITCGIVPLFHCFGCICIGVNSVVTGATAVFPSQSFDVEATLKAIETEKCTNIYAAPTMFIDIINHPKYAQTNFSSMKTGIIGASPCPPDVVDKIRKKMVPYLSVGYGSTETCPAICVHQFDLPNETKNNNCGKVIKHTEVKIVDHNDQAVPFGTAGEVCARGFNIFKGYFEDEESTRQTIRDGWYHSGDLGTLSEDGFVAVIGRIKDLVIRGGENVYPTEIEDFLIPHPKIFEVQVVGVPDDRMGEELCACIKLKDGQSMDVNEVKAFCKGKLSHFKIPRYVNFVDEFPKTPTGKIQKYILKERMEKWLKETGGSS